jgi:hypothetical protein
LLRYAPEKKFSPQIVTVKWLLKNLKLTTRLKNKTLKAMNSDSPEHMHLKFLTPLNHLWRKL